MTDEDSGASPPAEPRWRRMRFTRRRDRRRRGGSGPPTLRERFGPWLSAGALALLAAAGAAWLRSPARQRPATLPADATIVDEDAYADGSYDIHLRAGEMAFERWMDEMGMRETDPEHDGRARVWRAPEDDGCRISAYFIPEHRIGAWGRACGDPHAPALGGRGVSVEVHVLPP